MTWSFSSMDLRTRLVWLRRVVPVIVFAFVLFYQFFSLSILRNVSELLHLAVDLVAYGLIGPAASWLAINWILRNFDEREAARAAKAQAERAQQNAIEKAREQERMLAAICSNSADAIVSLDTNGILLTWNRGAEMIFGFRADEVLGQHYRVIVPSELDSRGEVEWLAEQMKEHGFIQNYETERVAKDGHRVIVDLTRTAITNEKGEIIGSSAILRDISARVQSEKAIQQLNLELETKVIERTAQVAAATEELRRRNTDLEKANVELKELDDLKSEFVSMVSHELRAPLTNINGAIELLLEGSAPCYDPEHRDLLLIVSEQSQRLTRLVQGILNVSRIEAGQLVLQPQAFNILSLIDKVINIWETRGIANRLIRPSTVNLPSIWADRDRTEEILINLIDNAIKYSSEGAPISIEAESNGRFAAVSVSDHGVGIPEGEIERIFEKFHRVERQDAKENYGHGLGLYICRRLVEAQGGQIWVESVIGEGSTFRFSLPLAGRSDLEPAAEPHRQTLGGRG